MYSKFGARHGATGDPGTLGVLVMRPKLHVCAPSVNPDGLEPRQIENLYIHAGTKASKHGTSGSSRGSPRCEGSSPCSVHDHCPQSHGGQWTVARGRETDSHWKNLDELEPRPGQTAERPKGARVARRASQTSISSWTPCLAIVVCARPLFTGGVKPEILPE